MKVIITVLVIFFSFQVMATAPMGNCGRYEVIGQVKLEQNNKGNVHFLINSKTTSSYKLYVTHEDLIVQLATLTDHPLVLEIDVLSPIVNFEGEISAIRKIRNNFQAMYFPSQDNVKFLTEIECLKKDFK